MIKFEGVTKRYRYKTVLDSINLQIQGHEFVSIIGPSGSGKTTLLHILLGTVKPTNGHVTVDSLNITKLGHGEVHALRRKIGIITQDDMLLPTKTIEENISFVLEVSGYEKSYIKAKTNEVIELVGLLECRKDFPKELSAGERRKAAIARALVLDPQLLIADEPTSSLDPESASEIIKLLIKANERGTTVILATHHKELVNTVNKRVIRLELGRIVSDKAQSGYHNIISKSK